MIDKERTMKEFGYDTNELSKGSGRKIWAICERCKRERVLFFRKYRDLCKSCSILGRKHTEETRQRMIKSKQNISKETRQKMSMAQSGNKHPNWNPNLTDENRQHTRHYPEYVQWRKKVFERDSYTCQICYELGVYLNAHHLDGYAENPEIRTTLENGITLCKTCHNNFHHRYGRGNNTKEQFIEFKG